MGKPNLLFIFTDEQTAKTMKAYGNDFINTPNLDKLADDSVVFQNTYVTQPVCTPSRSSIMGGLYPHANGCVDNNKFLDESKFPTMPRLSDFSEYDSAYMGKWHLGNEIFRQHGFDEWVSIEDDYVFYYSDDRDKDARSDYHHFLLSKNYLPDLKNGKFSRMFCTRIPEEHSKPAFLADRAIDYLNRKKDDPFMLYINFLEPHMPFYSARDNQYDPDEIPMPPNYPHPPTEKDHMRSRVFAAQFEKLHKNDREWREFVARYYGLVSLVDTHVGRILDHLKALGLYDDTIIVFTSDHGDMMSGHSLFKKTFIYEECCKVPFIVHLPKEMGAAPKSVNNPVSQIDIVPTLLEAMGKKTNYPVHGVSLMPALTGSKLPDRDVFYEWNLEDPAFMSDSEMETYPQIGTPKQIKAGLDDERRVIVTQDGWKFAWSRIGQHELYNLKEDPYEMNNVYSVGSNKKLIQELAGKITKWQLETQDIIPLATDNLL